MWRHVQERATESEDIQITCWTLSGKQPMIPIVSWPPDSSAALPVLYIAISCNTQNVSRSASLCDNQNSNKSGHALHVLVPVTVAAEYKI
jgi:hypothetical protein